MAKVTLTTSGENFCRLAFAQNIFEKGSIAGSKPAFSCKGIINDDHPVIKKIEAAEAEVAREKWGPKADKVLALIRKKGEGVLHDGDLKPEWDGFEGHLYVNCNGQNRPGIYDRDKTPLAAEDGRPYSGCFVNLMIDVWPQDNQYGKKINATLLGMQFVKDGDSFAAGAPPADADDFADLGVDGDDDDDLMD